MNIFIDCEWNEFGGELISMALCAETGEEFYEVLPCDEPGEWVAKNVIPILDKAPIDKEEFQHKLAHFLAQFVSVNIIADWPEDIANFCNALITGPGERINTPPMSMQIMRIDAGSEKPHNALHDARGIRKAVLAI
jgi:hypothetical protein